MKPLVAAMCGALMSLMLAIACGARTDEGVRRVLADGSNELSDSSIVDMDVPDNFLRCDGEVDCRYAPGTTCQFGQCCNGVVGANGTCRCGNGPSCDGVHSCCHARDGGALICGDPLRDCQMDTCPSCPPH